MTEKTRHWLFRIFVFLFVVITIILSLYATGYRFNLSWPLRLDKILLKTGTLALDTSPKGATVTISSETKISSGLPLFNSKKEKVTPIKIKNLLPGEYIVSFTLDNYWPYQKKLRVNPEQTTFLEDVILFRKSLPLNVFAANPQAIEYSPNGRYALLKDLKTIVNLETEQSVKNNVGEIKWLDDGKQISDGALIINLENNATTDYSAITGKIKSSQLIGNLLVYQSDKNLSVLDTKTKETNLINSGEDILNYTVIGNTVFIVTNNQIKSFDLKNKTVIASAKLLSSKNFTFTVNNKSVLLSDNEHKISYIIDLNDSSKIIKDIIRGGLIFKWLDDNKLVYTSDSEIYIYDLSQTKSYLITRLSEKINSLSWSNNNYLIYSTDKTIGTINLINSGNDITVLWQGNNISSLYLNNKDGILYFSGSIGDQNGLYKMIIK